MKEHSSLREVGVDFSVGIWMPVPLIFNVGCGKRVEVTVLGPLGETSDAT